MVSTKSLLLVFRRAPYGRGLARAGYDLALAAAALDQPVALLFMDDGVWQLLPDQQGAAIDAKTISSTLDSLPLYDIDVVYADAESLSARKLSAEELRPGVEIVGADAIAGFIEKFDQVVGF